MPTGLLLKGQKGLYTLFDGEKEIQCRAGSRLRKSDTRLSPGDNVEFTVNDDGTGFITEIFKPEDYDTVLCCGPEIMMKKVVEMCKEKGVQIYVSMEKHMACGVGACLVCTCKTKDGNKRTCKDGPVFKGSEVVWEN